MFARTTLESHGSFLLEGPPNNSNSLMPFGMRLVSYTAVNCVVTQCCVIFVALLRVDPITTAWKRSINLFVIE